MIYSPKQRRRSSCNLSLDWPEATETLLAPAPLPATPVLAPLPPPPPAAPLEPPALVMTSRAAKILFHVLTYMLV